MIPLVPNSCLELLEAPVPCIMVLHHTVESNKNFSQITFTQDTVVVLLYNNKIIHYPGRNIKTNLRHLPRLGNLKENIAKTYSIFERTGPNLLANYTVTKEMKTAVEEIITKVEAGIGKAVLNYLPLIPPKTINNEVDLGKVKRILMGNIKPVDESFVELLCDTQMFAAYVDESNKERLSILDSKY